MTEIDLSIPDFLLRSNWTQAQKRKADKAWEDKIKLQQERSRRQREEQDRLKMIERTQRKLDSLNKHRIPGTVADKIAASLERKLERLGA